MKKNNSKIHLEKKELEPLQNVKKNMLVLIEDDPLSGEMAKFFLENFFNNIKSFTSTEDAEFFLKENKVDVIISDYFLPGKSATMIVKDLKKENPNLKYFIASGSYEDVPAAELFNGVDGFIEKPYTHSELKKFFT